MAKKKVKHKWSQDQCRQRYVLGESADFPDGYGNEITLRQLTEVSNRSLSALAKWASEGNWCQQRDQKKIEVRSKTDQKLIEKISDKGSDIVDELNREHLNLARTMRKLNFQALKVLGIEAMGTLEKPKPFEKQVQVLKKKEIHLAIQRYGQNALLAAQLEREIAGAKYTDLNIAIAATLKAGLIVSEPKPEK